MIGQEFEPAVVLREKEYSLSRWDRDQTENAKSVKTGAGLRDFGDASRLREAKRRARLPMPGAPGRDRW